MSDRSVLPVHGFVLAGGKSSRMGRDKATMGFAGVSMVETAVQKLRTFCADVSIAGNRTDLIAIAPVVCETRTDAGPIAGIEAGLRAALHAWSLFIPVDTPVVPALLLEAWAKKTCAGEITGVRLSTLRANRQPQPAFCLLHRHCLPALFCAADAGERKLSVIFEKVALSLGPAALHVIDAESLVQRNARTRETLELEFSNINTPRDLFMLEQEATAASSSADARVREESVYG